MQAKDGSGDYAIVVYDDHDNVVEVQEYHKDGTFVARTYAEVQP